MNRRCLALVILVLSFAFAGRAWAGDVTVTFNGDGTITVDPANGIGTVGDKVVIVNNRAGPIIVTVTQGDNTTIIDGLEIPAGGDTEEVVTAAGVVEVCYEDAGGGRDADCFDLVFDVPIPTVSEWGLIILTLLLLTAGTIVIARGRRPAAV